MGTNGTPPTPKQTTQNAPTSPPPPKKKDQQSTNNQGKPSQTPNIIDYIIPTIIIEKLLDQ